MTQNADYGDRLSDLAKATDAGANHEYIKQFVEEHGHAPWISCGDPGYGCLAPNGS